MLELKDFSHLPQLDALIDELTDAPRMVVVAGLDPRVPAPGVLPSGRGTFFRILARHLLVTRRGRALVVSEERDPLRVPRQLWRRVETVRVERNYTYTDRVAYALTRPMDLLIIDRLDHECAALALEAAASGLPVLAQADTIFRGAAFVRYVLDQGVPRELLRGLGWVLGVARLGTLCARCKQSHVPEEAVLGEWRRRYPHVALDGPFFRAGACRDCHMSGREGEVALFDVWDGDGEPDGLLSRRSRLPMEEYALCLAAQGEVAPDDAARLDGDQLQQLYSLYASGARALAAAEAGLQRKTAELDAANEVLRHRTEAVISLEDIGRALSASAGLIDLGARICRRARELCGADRAILYYLRPGGAAEVLAVVGWDEARVHQRVYAELVLGAGHEPEPFVQPPPGLQMQNPDVAGVALRAGLRVPLVAQEEVVGVMLVHTTSKSSFAPGAVALLRAFANQAAVAIQRTGLIEALQEKVDQLEAAQAELVKKERIERELELARQVQQSMLPRIFPMVPGYAFAARSEPARQVGGDFYDVILLDGDQFGVVVADVSDKGMPAALFMALTRSLLLAEARRERSPRQVLYNVHRLLRELGEASMFVTVFYGVVDGSTRRLTYARAGHDRPLVLRDGAAVPLGGQGTFLGFLDATDLNLSEESVDLAPGDRLVMYSDGLTDALAPDGQAYGLARLAPMLAAHASSRAVELCEAVFAELDAYQRGVEQYDDMTLLVVEVT